MADDDTMPTAFSARDNVFAGVLGTLNPKARRHLRVILQLIFADLLSQHQ